MFSLQKIRHIKYYTLLLICFVTSLAYSQKANSNDTLLLKDNTIYIGKINKEDFKQYQFIVSGTDKIVYILKSDIVRIGELTSSSNTQTVSNDTMYLKDGTMYVGKFLGDVYKNYEFTPLGSKKIVTIPKESVLSITNHSKQWTTTVDDVTSTDWKTKAVKEDNYSHVTRFDTLSFESLRFEVKKMKIQSMVAGQDLQKAGKCGIAGGVLSLGGTILSVVGAVTGRPALAYVGAGVGGTGMILNFVAFGKLIKAGRRTR